MIKNSYIDFLKGIAILSVLYGHCLQYGSGVTFLQQELYWDNTVMKLIYSFHMPLFIAISGYLFYFSIEKHGVKKCIYRRIKAMLPICMTWGIILLGYDIAMGSNFNFVRGIARFVRYILTDFWFLWAVMLCTFCVSIVEGLLRKKMGVRISWSFYIILFILFFVTPDIFWLNAHKFMLPFFVAGFYYARNKSVWINNRIVGLISTFIWIILLFFYSKDSYIYTTGITILEKNSAMNQFVIDIYRYTIGVFGVITVTYWTKVLYNKMCDNCFIRHISILYIIENLGRDSIVYYILSTYLFIWIVPVVTLTFDLNYLVVFIETIVVTILCFVVKIILSRFGSVSNLIIGK